MRPHRHLSQAWAFLAASTLCACIVIPVVLNSGPHGPAHPPVLCQDFPTKIFDELPFLPQGIFPIQGSNACLLCLLHWQKDSYLGSPALHLSLENDTVTVLAQYSLSNISSMTPAQSHCPRGSYVALYISALLVYSVWMFRCHQRATDQGSRCQCSRKVT